MLSRNNDYFESSTYSQPYGWRFSTWTVEDCLEALISKRLFWTWAPLRSSIFSGRKERRELSETVLGTNLRFNRLPTLASLRVGPIRTLGIGVPFPTPFAIPCKLCLYPLCISVLSTLFAKILTCFVNNNLTAIFARCCRKRIELKQNERRKEHRYTHA
jgi:hypothetical protein